VYLTLVEVLQVVKKQGRELQQSNQTRTAVCAQALQTALEEPQAAAAAASSGSEAATPASDPPVPNTKSRTGGTRQAPPKEIHHPRMASSFCFGFGFGFGRRRPIIACFVPFFLLPILLLVSFLASASAAAVTTTKQGSTGNATRRVAFRSEEELRGFRSITARLARLRDASVKTIQARAFVPFFPSGDSKCSDRRLRH
jgi:hypothetical protein